MTNSSNNLCFLTDEFKKLDNGFNQKSLYPFIENHNHYIFDSESLALIKVDDLFYSFIVQAVNGGINNAYERLKAKYSRHQINKIIIDLKKIKQGYFGFLRPSSYPKLEPKARNGLREYYIGITHNCNLACIYCYSNKIGPKQDKKVLNENMAEKIVDWIYESHHSGDIISIILWGGEPLLNWKVFKKIVVKSRDYAQKFHIPTRFATTTNATLLSEEHFDFLAQNRVSLNISIDGSQDIHDLYRVTKEGKGTYAKIFQNINGLLCKYHNYFPIAHITLTQKTIPYLFESVKSIRNLGFKYIIFKPVDYYSELSFNKDLSEILKDQLRQFRDYIVSQINEDNSDSIIPQIKGDLGAIYHGLILESTCNSGVTTAYIDTDLSIHSCYNLMGGNYPTEIGHIDRSEINEALQDYWCKLNTKYWKSCGSCVFKYLCGGGCIAKSIFNKNTYPKPSPSECSFSKIFQEHRLRLYARLITEHREFTALHLKNYHPNRVQKEIRG